MHRFIFILRQLLMLPIRLVTSPGELFSSFVDDSERSKALLLGLPAILVSILGVSALLWAQFGLTPQLEDRYKAEVDKSNRVKTKLKQELSAEVRMLRASQRTNPTLDPNEPLIPKDDERLIEYEELQEVEDVFLEKLLKLNPDEPDYRYRLAIVSIEQGQVQRAMALMRLIAPDDEPGYGKAHLWQAQNYIRARAADPAVARQNRALALQHAEHTLMRNQDNLPAKLIKANVLFSQQRFESAYTIFDELLEQNPVFYEPMLLINRRLKREERDSGVINRALAEFQLMLQNQDLPPDQWVSTWSHIVKCLINRTDFQRAETMVKVEIEVLSQNKEGAAKKKFMEQLMAGLYLQWVSHISKEADDPEAVELYPQKLDFLKKAYQYNPNDQSVLQLIARIAINAPPQYSMQATQIYNPYDDVDAPALVLNEMGSDALAKSNYSNAIRYFEMALAKSSKNPMILNNLAYTYLVAENSNPERALKLVDEAINALPNNEDGIRVRTHFFDTRGRALMQLNRMTEAAAAFEIAIQDRPDNRRILEALVKCYQGNNLSPQVYLDRLELLGDEPEVKDESPIFTPTETPNASDAPDPSTVKIPTVELPSSTDDGN